MGRLKPAVIAWCVIAVISIGSICRSAVADERLDLWGFAGFEELNTLDDEADLPSVAKLDTAVTLESRLRYDNFYNSLQRFRAEVSGRTVQFLDLQDRSSYRIRPRLEWRQFFSDTRETEIRLRGEYEYKWRDEAWLYSRMRGRAELRQTIDPTHLIFIVGQVGQQDFNGDVASGLDQFRYVGEIGHEWTPNEDRTRVRTRVGYETADGEENRRDYVGYYAEVDGRHPVSTRTEIFGEARIHFRSYDGAFDPPDPTIREDERYRLVGGARYALNSHFNLIGEAGWAANQGNIDDRNFDGFVFRLGVEANFNLWTSRD